MNNENICSHILRRGPRMGLRCDKSRVGDSNYCRRHSYMHYSSEALEDEDENEDENEVSDEIRRIINGSVDMLLPGVSELDMNNDIETVLNDLQGYLTTLNSMRGIIVISDINNISKNRELVEEMTDIEGDELLTYWDKWRDDKFYYSNCNRDCAICMEVIKKGECTGVKLGCGHEYHYKCIKPWEKTSRTCPTCRREIKDIKFERTIRGDINTMMKEYSIDEIMNELNKV